MSDFNAQLRRAKDGDDKGLDAILERVEVRLRRYIQTRLGERLRALVRDSDVLQNAYVELLKALPTFEGDEDEFVTWVTAIIENDIRRQNRYYGAAKRQPPRTSEGNALARILLTPPRTPSAELASIETQARLARAMAELPGDYARVIELAVFQELPHRDVAAAMNRSESATRMLLSRARAALSLALERLEGDSAPRG